jgi:site-specific DNA-cytosine methylase
MLTTYHKIGKYRGSPRIFIESHRLQQLGFEPKTFLDVSPRAGNCIELRPSPVKTKNRVSYRQLSGLDCPIIDINSQLLLAAFAPHTELRLQATYKQLMVQPSRRSFNILEHRTCGLPIPTMEYFCGGSTLSQAITGDPRFRLVGAVEISNKFASHFAAEHPDVPLYNCDIRNFNPEELPRVAFMFASIPCNCFSSLGIAKKKLKASGSELGDTGDLFLSFVHHVAAKMPLAICVENVPGFFGDSAIAGRLLMTHLERIGYHVHYFDILPHSEWGEPQDRRRGVMVATLYGKFYPSIPMIPFAGKAGDYLDAPDPVKDKEDADAIRNSIEGRRLHQARHRAEGHNFGFSVINHESTKIPTITRSYHKINGGPFVSCEGGLRMLRQKEIERIMGFQPQSSVPKPYSTAVEILGQGVQTRVFKVLLHQLGDYLEHMILTGKTPNGPERQQIR